MRQDSHDYALFRQLQKLIYFFKGVREKPEVEGFSVSRMGTPESSDCVFLRSIHIFEMLQLNLITYI
jgi:hypothetical protein